MSSNGNPDTHSPAPGTPRTPPTPDKCLILKGIRILASPNAGALQNLIKGQSLTVSYNGTSLDVFDGPVKCGTIISNIQDFVDCINMLHDYVAIVLSVSAGRCEVEIRLK